MSSRFDRSWQPLKQVLKVRMLVGGSLMFSYVLKTSGKSFSINYFIRYEEYSARSVIYYDEQLVSVKYTDKRKITHGNGSCNEFG